MKWSSGPLTFIPGKNRGRYPYCHSLYIEAETKVLIDPASDREKLIEIRDGSGVDAIWLSHWHEDHFMHLDLFPDQELWICEPDAKPLSSLEELFDAYCMNDEEKRSWTPTMRDLFHFQPRTPHRFIGKHEVVDLGGVTVEVIHTPGHTPGHCSLYFRELETLFMGDYDLTAFGPWYGDRDSDIDAIIDSLNRLRAIPAKQWITSHEEGILDATPDHLWDDYLKVIDDREARLLELLKEPRSMPEIVDARIVYLKKREPKEFYDFGERAIMGKHLERLIRNQAVVEENGAYRLT